MHCDFTTFCMSTKSGSYRTLCSCKPPYVLASNVSQEQLDHFPLHAAGSMAERLDKAWPPSDEDVLRDIEAVCQDPRTVQHQVLHEILEKHGSCQYLQRLGLKEKTDAESFKATVPLSTYSDYEEAIKRLMDGDKAPVLSCSPPVAFARSTGTSAGISKYFPVLAGTGQILQTYPGAVRRSVFPPKITGEVGKDCMMYIADARVDTKSGAKACNLSTTFLDRSEYEYWHNCVGRVTSPLEVVRCSDFKQAIYGHLLCLLIFADVVESIQTLFAYAMVECFRALERLWPSLCHDIRTGDINKLMITDDVVRQAILSKVLLSPMPEIADKIEKECEKGDWNGIILRLLSNLQYLVCISTGPMLPFSALLDRYTRKGFPKLGVGYGSSEGGHNAFPLKVSLHDPELFSLWPSLMFYEFIPVTPEQEEQTAHFSGVEGAVEYQKIDKPVELTQLKPGLRYELVLTTRSGFYRYHMGDILQVTGFYKAIPIFKFVCRKGVMLSINLDKTDEAELQIVVYKAAKILEHQASLAEYSSYADHSTNPGHYVIYWELESKQADRDTEDIGEFFRALQDSCNLLDSSLNENYTTGRKNKSIGPLELRILKPGTFEKLRDYALQQGASLSQYKTPRCVTNPALRDILDAGVLCSFQSCSQ